MSEHIQSLSGGRQPPEFGASQRADAPRSETHERTPGVSHERGEFSLRLVLGVAGGLIVTALVIHLVVWGALTGFEKRNALPSGSLSTLAEEDATRPLDQRLDNVPPPHLEGIERESSLLIVRDDKGEEQRFYASLDVRVHLGDNEKARLFELREGQRVTLTYYLPNGVGGGVGVVTAVTSPPSEKADKKSDTAELPDVARTFNATILKVEPRSIAAARQWAEVQMERYGWTDRDKEIVHVPVEKAMEEVLKSPQFRTEKNKKKSGGRLASPSRSSSGRSAVGGRP